MHYSSRTMIAKSLLVIGLIGASGICLAQSASAAPSATKPNITVTELPPEAIPTGICRESYSGYLEIPEHGKPKNKAFTPQQIGDYVNKRLGEGYSLEMYPQASGRLFIIETCHSIKR